MINKPDTIIQSKLTIEQHKSIFLLCTKCNDHIPSMKLWKTEDNLFVFLNCQFCKQTELIELAEYLDLMKQLANKTHKCTHKPEHSLLPSTVYCMNCSNWLCKDCSKDHTRYPELFYHMIISTKITNESQCNLHKGMLYEYYCQECNQSLCKDCFKSHEELKHNPITIIELKERIKNIHFKNVLNQFNFIRDRNKDNRNTLIDSINNHIPELDNLKEQIISEYKKNEALNKMINMFIVALISNYELLIKTHLPELMNNLLYLLVLDKTLPKLNQSDLNTNCLNLIDYFKTNYIVRVAHKQRDLDENIPNLKWIDDNIERYVEYEWLNGAQYKGQWKNDKRNGTGVSTYLNGNIYEGNWVDDRREGHGVYKWFNGAQYTGQWKNGKRNGKGINTNIKGHTYDGDWVDDKREGYGVLKSHNGEQYKGQWKNDKRNGKGINNDSKGHIYDGDWVNGKSEGFGVYNWPNGEQYKGQWKNGKRNGKGIYTDSKGHIYNGDWIDGKRIN